MKVHNGLHKYDDEPHFEWWYFHIITDDAYLISIIIHPTDIFGVKPLVYTSMSLLSPSGEISYYNKTLPQEVFENCLHRLDCQYDGFFIKESDKDLLLNIKFSEIEITANIIKEEKPLLPNNGVLYNSALKSNYWFVNIPNGETDIELKFSGGNIIRKNGHSYHDHNWGNALIQNVFKSWYWGHISLSQGYLFFYYIVNKKNTLIRNAILKNGDKYIHSQDYAITTFKSDKNLTKYGMHDIFIIDDFAEDDKLKIKIEVMRVFRDREITSDKNHIIHYYRSKCDVKIHSNENSEESTGIVENFQVKDI